MLYQKIYKIWACSTCGGMNCASVDVRCIDKIFFTKDEAKEYIENHRKSFTEYRILEAFIPLPERAGPENFF